MYVVTSALWTPPTWAEVHQYANGFDRGSVSQLRGPLSQLWAVTGYKGLLLFKGFSGPTLLPLEQRPNEAVRGWSLRSDPAGTFREPDPSFIEDLASVIVSRIITTEYGISGTVKPDGFWKAVRNTQDRIARLRLYTREA